MFKLTFRVCIKSFNKLALINMEQKFKELLKGTQSKKSGTVFLPTRIRKFCVLRSPQNDKDSREHFEFRLYKCLFNIETNSPATIDSLLRVHVPADVLLDVNLDTNSAKNCNNLIKE